MKKVSLFLVLLLGIVSSSFSQSGNFYLTHYQPNIDNIDNHSYAIAQDTLGVMYAANRKGVLKFNGTSWEIISTPFSVYSLDLEHNNNQFFIGGKNDFGYIMRQPTGKEVFYSLRDTIYNNVDFKQTIIWQGNVYFYGDGVLIKYNLENKKITKKWTLIDKKKIIAFFIAEDKAYIEVADRGFYLLDEDIFKAMYIQLPDKDRVASAKTLPNEEGILVIGASGKLYLFSRNIILPYETEEKEYLERSQLLDMMLLDNELLIFSTLRGGCIVMNYKERKIVQIVNYQSGLPDEEIFAMGKDKNKGAWIAHNYGFSRLDFGMPLRSFSQYGGLEGHILAVQPFKDVLYVATSTGVFYLDEIKQFQETTEKTTLVFKTIRRNNSAKNTKTTETKPTVPSSNTTPANTENQSGEIQVTNPNANKVIANKPKYSYYRQLIEKKFVDLKSVRHLFKRVEGIEGKCEKFVVVDNVLLVCGNAGLFMIGDKKEEPAPVQPKRKWYQPKPKVEQKTITKTKNKKAIKISDEAIRYAVKAAKKDVVYASTAEGRLIMVNMIDKKSRNLVRFDDEINKLTEDKKGNVWVCGSNFIYMVDLKKAKPKVTSFSVENGYTDQILPVKVYGRTYFVMSAAAYYFDEGKNDLVIDSVFMSQINPKSQLLSYNDRLLWTNYKNQWNVFGEYPYKKENFAFFKLFDNIERIIADGDGKHLWLITQSGGLYKFDASSDLQLEQGYQLLVNYIKNRQGNYIPIANNFNIDFYNNALTFSLTTPDYLKSGRIEYQYILEGNMADWSEWTDEGHFAFPSLNAGGYTLKVRSRNVFGSTIESAPYYFTIYPPYWQTSWFSALEVAFFLVLLLAAGIINRAIKHENRFLAIGKRIVTMLTLVVCMEFMQNIFQNYIDINGSPVKDFAVEVFVALILLPLEWVLIKTLTAQFKKPKIKSMKEEESVEKVQTA